MKKLKEILEGIIVPFPSKKPTEKPAEKESWETDMPYDEIFSRYGYKEHTGPENHPLGIYSHDKHPDEDIMVNDDKTWAYMNQPHSGNTPRDLHKHFVKKFGKIQ